MFDPAELTIRGTAVPAVIPGGGSPTYHAQFTLIASQIMIIRAGRLAISELCLNWSLNFNPLTARPKIAVSVVNGLVSMSQPHEEADVRPETPRMGTPVFLFWCLLFGGVGAYFFQRPDYVGVAGTAAIAIACFSGFRLGASRIAASLLGLAAAIAVAPQLGVSQEHRFTEWFGTTGLANRFLSVGVIGLAITLVATLMVVIITNRMMKDRPRLAKSNSWLGFLIGGAEAAIAVLLLLGGILIMEPMEQQRSHLRSPDDVRGQTVGKAITTVAMRTRASQLGPVIDRYNPFTRIPQLNKIEKVQQTVGVLSDPGKIDNLIRHPDITRLQERPEMKRAVEQLMSDPEIKEILYSGEALGRDAVITLLNHPAVLELVDQPGFLEEANKIIEQSDALNGFH